MQEKYLNTNLGNSSSNPLQRKILAENLSEFYLTSPGRILVDPAQDWLTPAIFALALRHLLCPLCQLSRLFQQFSTVPVVQAVPSSSGSSGFCVTSSFSTLCWPFWLYISPEWAQVGLASVLLAAALPPVASLCLFVSTPELSLPLCCN